jgi:hypothetical protein
LYSDKTNWRKILQGEAEFIVLYAINAEILKNAAIELNELKNQYGLQAISDVEFEMINIAYPVETYPTKIKSINLGKELGFEELLQGIKGQ